MKPVIFNCCQKAVSPTDEQLLTTQKACFIKTTEQIVCTYECTVFFGQWLIQAPKKSKVHCILMSAWQRTKTPQTRLRPSRSFSRISASLVWHWSLSPGCNYIGWCEHSLLPVRASLAAVCNWTSFQGIFSKQRLFRVCGHVRSGAWHNFRLRQAHALSGLQQSCFKCFTAKLEFHRPR